MKKPCRECGKTKPTTEFYRRKGNKDGLRTLCKACSRAVAARHVRKMKARTSVRLPGRKNCAECRRSRSSQSFYRDKSSKDGLDSYCKECRKEKRRKYRQSPAGRRARERQAESGHWKYGKGAISSLRHGANKRGLDFDITADQLTQWWHATPDVCEYCGITIKQFMQVKSRIIGYKGKNWEILKFKRFFRSPKHAGIRWMTIDRRDSATGYMIRNLAKACWICNSLKQDFFSPQEMKRLGRRIMSELRSELR